ncbi:hypothetical protein [Hymenobacter terrenus]|uniref:hypothetical protein n=1 Tax=Hymenobacter terrenus TaxID=1629124 RepID=UPI000ACC035F|nr:hypothetical protein [Hymenobacter terrenus]
MAPRFNFFRLLPALIRVLSTTTSALFFLLRWLLISGLVGGLAGTASAGFLVALDGVTHWREAHPWALPWHCCQERVCSSG